MQVYIKNLRNIDRYLPKINEEKSSYLFLF